MFSLLKYVMYTVTVCNVESPNFCLAVYLIATIFRGGVYCSVVLFSYPSVVPQV